MTSSPPPSGRSGSSSGGRSNVERFFRDPTPAAAGSRLVESGVAPVRGVGHDRARLAREHQRPRHGVRVGNDPVARLERPGQERACERVLDQPLDGPLERPRAERGVGALAHDQRPRGGRQLEHQVVGRDPPLEVGQLEVRDGRELGVAERVEHDDLVDPVQELRPELHPQLVGDLALHRLVAVAVGLAGERLDLLAADVAGHDHDGVLEVHRPALRVGQAAVVEHLEQHVEHVRVGLLDLVEQHHLVRPPPDGLGQLAALLVADVAGRRPDQPRHGELLHVLAHVDPDHRLVVVEHELGERPGELGLADARRPQEQERPDGPLGVLEPGTRATNGVGHGLDGLVLADHAIVEPLLHVDELLELALHQAGDRDAGPGRDDLGDVVGRDLLLEQRAGALERGDRRLLLGQPVGQLSGLAVLQLGGACRSRPRARPGRPGPGAAPAPTSSPAAPRSPTSRPPSAASSRRPPRRSPRAPSRGPRGAPSTRRRTPCAGPRARSPAGSGAARARPARSASSRSPCAAATPPRRRGRSPCPAGSAR